MEIAPRLAGLGEVTGPAAIAIGLPYGDGWQSDYYPILCTVTVIVVTVIVILFYALSP